MKKFLADKKELVFILVLVLLSLAKLYRLDGGLVLGEPDEHTHALIVRNLKNSLYPQVDGKGWYYGLPLYFYLSYLVSFTFPVRFLALRTISFLASVVLTFGLYVWVREKVSKGAAFLSALIFVLSPLSIFYSRLGLIEMTVVAFISLFLFCFDLAWGSRSRKLALLSGLFLGCGVLTKYTALPFLIVPLFFILYSLFRNPLTREGEYLPLDIVPTLTLVSAFITFVPLAFVIYRHEPFFFRQQLSSVLGGQTGFGFYLSYLRPFVGWMTWPVAAFALGGVYLIWARKKFGLRNVLGFSLYTAYFVFTRDELVPRYFLVLAPFVSVFAGVGFDSSINRIIELMSLDKKYVWWVGAVVLVLLTASKSYEAFRATQHNVLEDVGQFIRERNINDRWVFSNYWPPQVGFAAGTSKATWLANCEWETRAFANPPVGKSALDILNEEGGFVVLEDIYSEKLINPPCRTEAWDFIRQNYQPVKTFTDPSPNFPFTSYPRNRLEVYDIK